MNQRKVTKQRHTKETEVAVELNLDGTGMAEIDTGLGILDHLLSAFTKHSGIDLKLKCSGDLHIDDHHSAEDCAITLGLACDEALGDRRGINRFGWAYAPLDESLARAVVDLSGRGCAVGELDFEREQLGTLATENVGHFVQSFAANARASIHLDVIRGENDHHRAEAAFKALALAFRQAIALGDTDDIPSTKGAL